MNPASTPEVCDGLDNDLNDGTDEGFVNTDGDTQADCIDADDDGDSFTDAAETAAGSDPLNPASTPEVCDGLDNDLDGLTDEGSANTDGDGQADCVDADDDGDNSPTLPKQPPVVIRSTRLPRPRSAMASTTTSTTDRRRFRQYGR